MRRSDHDEIVRQLRKVIEMQRDEIRELRDRMMYMNGTPWTPPPIDPEPDPEPLEEHEDPLFPGYSSDPALTGV